MITEPRWRSGRSPSTPARWARTYPTSSHNATPFAHFLPPALPRRPHGAKTPARAGLSRPRARPPRAAARASRACSRAAATRLAAARPCAGGSPRHVASPAAARKDSLQHAAATPPPCAAGAIPRRLAALALRCSRWRSCGAGGLRLVLARRRHRRRPGHRRAGVGAAVRRARPCARRGALRDGALAAGQRADRARPNPTCACSALLQTPGSPAARLQPRRRAVARAARRASSSARSAPPSSLLGAARRRACSRLERRSAFPFGAGGAQGAIVLDTSDAARRASFLDAQAKHAGAHATQLPRASPTRSTRGGRRLRHRRTASP